MSGTVSVVVENGKYGVVSSEGIIIVAFGKYDWIETFDNGLARVRTEGLEPMTVAVIDSDGIHMTEEYLKAHPEERSKWGIINEAGEEVLIIMENMPGLMRRTWPDSVTRPSATPLKAIRMHIGT